MNNTENENEGFDQLAQFHADTIAANYESDKAFVKTLTKERKKYTIALTTNGHRDEQTTRATTDNTYTERDEAKAKAKRLNKLLSIGEKKHYKLKYKVFTV